MDNKSCTKNSFFTNKEMKVEQVAEIVHNANKTYCEQLGDFSQVRWELAPKEIQQSAIDGVNFKMNNPDATPTD